MLRFNDYQIMHTQRLECISVLRLAVECKLNLLTELRLLRPAVFEALTRDSLAS